MDQAGVIAALSTPPADGYTRDPHFPVQIPSTVFSGYYGFGPRGGRRPVPELGIVDPPLYTQFELRDATPHAVSQMAAQFETDETASRAMHVLSERSRGILAVSDAPDLYNLEPFDLGDEFGWAWQMTVLTYGGMRRTDIGWRRSSWMLNVLSWSVDVATAQSVEMARRLDTVLAASQRGASDR